MEQAWAWCRVALVARPCRPCATGGDDRPCAVWSSGRLLWEQLLLKCCPQSLPRQLAGPTLCTAADLAEKASPAQARGADGGSAYRGDVALLRSAQGSC